MSAHLYETDFFGWTRQQGQLLKSGRLTEVDTQHLIEEIEALGRSERRQLTIIEQRRRIAKLLAANPSLRAELDACFLDAYDDARFGAMKETGLALAVFPEQPDMDLSQTLAPDYWPEPGSAQPGSESYATGQP